MPRHFLLQGQAALRRVTMRMARADSISCEAALSVIRSLSITKPGLMPVPISATPQVLASASSRAASSGYFRNGYASSSHVETTAGFGGQAGHQLVHHIGQQRGS